jgi:hypothetical protein
MGDVKFSELYGVSRRAACAYRLRTRLPRADLAGRLVAETPVTWEGIYGAGGSLWRRKKRTRRRSASARAAAE